VGYSGAAPCVEGRARQFSMQGILSPSCLSFLRAQLLVCVFFMIDSSICDILVKYLIVV
jgi:hypothetical protein